MVKEKIRFPLAVVAVVSIALVAVLIWGICLVGAGDDRDTVQTPQQTTDFVASGEETTEPVPEPETTPRDVVAAFAAQHGLTLEDYPEKLLELLERNPETEEFVLNYPLEYGKEHTADISVYADTEGVPLFIQWDSQWGYKDYVGNVAGLSGCGPTCMAMVAYYFTRNPEYHPAYMMDFAQSNPQYANSSVATQWAFFGQGGAELGLTVKELTGEQIRSEEKIAQVLAEGKLIVAHMGPGVFTEIGHYIVITGYQDGKFTVNDPNSRSNSAKLWEFEEFADQIKMMWSFSQ